MIIIDDPPKNLTIRYFFAIFLLRCSCCCPVSSWSSNLRTCSFVSLTVSGRSSLGSVRERVIVKSGRPDRGNHSHRPSIHSCDCGSRLQPAVLSGLWFTSEWHPQLSEESHQTIRKHVGKASSMQETHVENFSIRSRCIIMFTLQLLARWVLFRTITHMI